MATTIVFSGGAKVEVTADHQQVRDALLADQWCQFEGRAGGGRAVHVNRDTVAYIEEAPSRGAYSF